MLKKLKSWFRRQILKQLFTPVRALTLVRARVDPEREIMSVDSKVSPDRGLGRYQFQIYVYYRSGGGLGMFYYSHDERDLFLSERQFIEGLVQ